MAITPNFYTKIGFMGLIASMLMLFTLNSCTDNPLSSSSDESGTFRVIMHDAPGDYQEVWVDIQRVEVNNEEDAEEGWVTISEPEQRYDLLELINGAHEVLGEEELEAGTYRQIRLILGDDNELVMDGDSYELDVPSGQQTGIKLNIDAEIEPGITYTLLLDFDAKRSIVKRGQTQQYSLKPVIKATNEAVTGNIAGEVDPVEAHPWIYAIAGDDTLSTTRSDEETGEFLLYGMEEGTYDVSFEPQDGFDDQMIEDVDVEIGESTDLGTIEFEENTDD